MNTTWLNTSEVRTLQGVLKHRQKLWPRLCSLISCPKNIVKNYDQDYVVLGSLILYVYISEINKSGCYFKIAGDKWHISKQLVCCFRNGQDWRQCMQKNLKIWHGGQNKLILFIFYLIIYLFVYLVSHLFAFLNFT